MKKTISCLFLFFITYCFVFSQESNLLKVQDTRKVNDSPLFNKQALRLDFKERSIINAPGSGFFSTNLTLSPWLDYTGELNHQLTFNQGGIFYRQGDFRNTTWNNWSKVFLTEPDGIIRDGIRIGRIGQIGNSNVPIGGKNIEYYIDFTGYRDVAPDQVGARISAIRYNRHIANLSYIQKTALVFYTNASGINGGTTDLLERMRISPEGYVGIGVNNPQNRLDVDGTIRATEVKVETGWADFVFDKDYKLASLAEVESHIQEHKHLPGIPSESEVEKNGGVGLGEMQVKLLQKIEELTLYMIGQEKRIQELEAELKEKNNSK